MKVLEKNTIISERYLIVSLQSKDNNSETYLAIDQTSGKSVLVKRVFCFDERQSQGLQREALALMKLEHQNLPKFIDYFSEGSARYLVAEYVSGKSLLEIIENSKKPLPLDWIIFWADQLLDALAYLHSQSPPIIHRDIRPENLKVSKEEDIFLIGFPLSVTGHETRTSYASLEQIKGTGMTERCDIYSLSATLYYLLTAQAPPDVITRADQVLNQLPDPIKPPSVVNTNVPKEISDFVIKGMSLASNLRYSSAKEMQRLLREVYARVKSSQQPLASTPQSGIKTEVLTDYKTAEPSDIGFKTYHVNSSIEQSVGISEEKAEVLSQPFKTQEDVVLPSQQKTEVLPQEVFPVEGGEKTLVLEESLNLGQKVKPPSAEKTFLIEEQQQAPQKKTEILPEDIFPQVVSSGENNAFSQEKPSIENFTFEDQNLQREIPNATVPLIKYEELTPENSEKQIDYQSSAAFEGTFSRESLSQQEMRSEPPEFQQAATQPAIQQQPAIQFAIPQQKAATAKSRAFLVVSIAILVFISGVVLIAASIYVFKDSLFPKEEESSSVNVNPKPTATPQVVVEQTPVETSPTPNVDTSTTPSNETLSADEKDNRSTNSNKTDSQMLSDVPSENRTITDSSQRKRVDQQSEGKIVPSAKQTPKKAKNNPNEEPKRTPERRLEILQ